MAIQLVFTVLKPQFLFSEKMFNIPSRIQLLKYSIGRSGCISTCLVELSWHPHCSALLMPRYSRHIQCTDVFTDAELQTDLTNLVRKSFNFFDGNNYITTAERCDKVYTFCDQKPYNSVLFFKHRYPKSERLITHIWAIKSVCKVVIESKRPSYCRSNVLFSPCVADLEKKMSIKVRIFSDLHSYIFYPDCQINQNAELQIIIWFLLSSSLMSQAFCCNSVCCI